MLCYCVFCGGKLEREERTVKEHLSEYGHMKNALLHTFLKYCQADDKIFHKVLRTLLDKCFADGKIFEVKGKGKPLNIASIVKPEKAIVTPADSVKRKHTNVFKDIVDCQAHSSTSESTKHDIDMVAKRIRTAEISVMDKADRDYLKMSAKLECRKEISALDMAIYKAESNTGTANIRSNLRPLLKKYNLSIATEKNIKAVEEVHTVNYESAIVSLSHKAASHDKNETKSGDLMARRTPVVYCDGQELLTKTLITLKNTDQLEVGPEKKIYVKLFVDSDASSTKVALNVLNQPACNSSYAHPMIVYTEAPDHHRNLEVIFKVVNRDLQRLKSHVFGGAHVQMLLCADTKALWAVLGMGQNGTYPCPLCEIHKDLMQVPRGQRALCKPRSYTGITRNYSENMRMTQCNPRTQAQFMNVCSRPVTGCFGEESDYLINWVAVPFLHINIKVGTFLWTEYGKLCEDIDFVLACNVADGFLPNCYSSTTDFGAMILRIEQGERISTKCNSGPLSSTYESFLRSINVVPEAYHGVSLTGVRAGYLVKANDSQFWKENFYNNEKIRPQDKLHFQTRLLALDRIKSSYKDILVIGGKNGKVGSTLEMKALAVARDNFLAEYRKFGQQTSVKIHLLEDHFLEQIDQLQMFSGTFNEQGGESTHSLFKNHEHMTNHIRNQEEKLVKKCELATRKYLLKLMSRN